MQRMRGRYPRKNREPLTLLLEEIDDRDNPWVLEFRLQASRPSQTLQSMFGVATFASIH